MITVIIQFNIKPGLEEDFKELTLRNVEDRRKAPGNIRMDFYRNESNKNEFVMIEIFSTQDSIDLYYESFSYKAWHAQTKNLISSIKGDDYKVLGVDQGSKSGLS